MKAKDFKVVVAGRELNLFELIFHKLGLLTARADDGRQAEISKSLCGQEDCGGQAAAQAADGKERAQRRGVLKDRVKEVLFFVCQLKLPYGDGWRLDKGDGAFAEGDQCIFLFLGGQEEILIAESLIRDLRHADRRGRVMVGQGVALVEGGGALVGVL